jgi:hypothetical protein
MKRIGIAAGFGVSFTNDGRPISHGRGDLEALRILADWLEENPSHEQHEDGKRWLSAKQKELAKRDARDAILNRRIHPTSNLIGD